MLRQKEVLEVVIALLKGKYPKPETEYYTDEIIKGFKQPCFFVKLIKQRNTETKNSNSNSISIAMTYFANQEKNKQLIFLDCEDNINEIFGKGFKVADRYLHVKSIAAERIGEEQDILQVTVSIDYLDSAGYDSDFDYRTGKKYDQIQTLNMSTTNKY